MTSVTYEFADGVARIAMDDGKANVLSTSMFDELAGALDRAEADAAVVLLTGRERTFSGGFDLRCPPEGWQAMVGAGARLAERLLSFPQPVVVACTGNAIAMGAFVLLSSDHRIGVAGDFRIGLNEAAIGLTVPYFGIALARHRLTRPYADRCTITGVLLEPEEAVTAGFLDRLVAPQEIGEAGLAAARALLDVDRTAHAATKLRIREAALAGVRDGIDRIEGGTREW